MVLGPNGAGKSLLLRLCHGLLRPSAGRIIRAGPENSVYGAMVFQRPVMLCRSAAANIDYALSLSGVLRALRPERIVEALRLAGLETQAGCNARVFSGGEQQRLAIARAWACRPEVLFLDEPTANLDPAAVRAIEAVINAIHDAGTRIIMTTHDLNQARRLGDEILFLHRGYLIEQASAAEFFTQARSEQARSFVSGALLD